jgi:glycosyltransferase involved in cell wall biosynthesis
VLTEAQSENLFESSCRELRMKTGILLMVRELHHGGSERQLTEIALGLDRTRFRPHVGAFQTDGIRAHDLRSAGVPIFHLPVRSFKSLGALTAGWALARYIRENNIRLVHAFDMPMDMYAIPITRFFTSAIALASQRGHLSLVDARQRRFVLFAERRAHGIVVNCQFLRRHMAEDAGIAPERIYLCYNGLDLTRFRPASAKRPAPRSPGALTIGVVSVLRPEKGLRTLLDAFAAALQTFANLRLLIIGSGPMLSQLQNQARELAINDACTFVPSTDQVDEWLRKIDIFVLPSLSEALSNALMEAMACGCCPIASSVGGNPELIEDGVRGLLFEPGNSVELACKLGELVVNSARRAQLAHAAHDFVHTNFSRAASAHRMGEIYEQLLSPTKAAPPNSDRSALAKSRV